MNLASNEGSECSLQQRLTNHRWWHTTAATTPLGAHRSLAAGSPDFHGLTASADRAPYATAYPVYGRLWGAWKASTMSSLGTPACTKAQARPVSVPSYWIHIFPS